MEDEFGPMPGDFTPTTYQTPSAEAAAPPTSQSQVPGTSGAPSRTPSAYGGNTGAGVSTGNPGGSPGGTPGNWLSRFFSGGGFGNLAGGQARQGGSLTPQQRALMQMGGRLLQPPGNPMRPGAPLMQLGQAGTGNPMLDQLMRLYGMDRETAMRLLAQTQPGGGSALTPPQQTQMYFGTTFTPPPQISPQPAQLQPPSSIPTAANPYGAPRMPMGPTSMLPPLGQGAFQPLGATQQQMPYSFAGGY